MRRRCTVQVISRVISLLQPPYYFLIWVSRFLLPGRISRAIGRRTGPYECPPGRGPHVPAPAHDRRSQSRIHISQVAVTGRWGVMMGLLMHFGQATSFCEWEKTEGNVEYNYSEELIATQNSVPLLDLHAPLKP